MDISNTILTDTVLPPEILPNIKGIDNAPDEQKKKFAKDFESLLIGRLLDEMGNSISELGEEDDGTMGQIKGIFNLYLSQHIGSNGGFGLWEQIYKSLSRQEARVDNQVETVDKQI